MPYDKTGGRLKDDGRHKKYSCTELAARGVTLHADLWLQVAPEASPHICNTPRMRKFGGFPFFKIQINF